MNRNAPGTAGGRRVRTGVLALATSATIVGSVCAPAAFAVPSRVPAAAAATTALAGTTGASTPGPAVTAAPCSLSAHSAVKVRILSPAEDTVVDPTTTPSLDVRGLIKGRGARGVTGVELYLDDSDLGTAPVVATTAADRAKGADGRWDRSIALPAGSHVLLACAQTAAGPIAVSRRHVVTAAITTAALPDAITGRPYRAQLTTTVPHPAWQATSALPAGLKLSKTGLLSGTPTMPGTTPLHLEAVDRSRTKGLSASAVVPLRVASPGPAAGTVCAWGSGSAGELGDGLAFDDSTAAATPRPVAVLKDVTAVAGTSRSGFALRTDGTVWGWGSATDGQLGTEAGTDTSTPVPVAGLSGITAVAGAFTTGYALRGDGTVWAWGLGGYANLGNGTYDQSSATPVQVSGLSDVTAIAGAGLTAYALKRDGTVWGWGEGGEGQLGDQPGFSDSYSTSVPVRIPGLASITAIAGNGDDGYALAADGSVLAWGWGGSGALGDGTGDAVAVPVPVRVGTLSGITAIAAGAHDGYALTHDGTVRAWGGGALGGLGNGGTADSSTPVQVSGLGSVTSIAGSVGATQYAVTSDGTVWAWGLGDYGTLGDGTGIGTYDHLGVTPVRVSGLHTALAAAGALQSGFALVAPGSDPATACSA